MNFAKGQFSCLFEDGHNGKNQYGEAANGSKDEDLVELLDFFEKAFDSSFGRKILRYEFFSKINWLDETKFNQILEFFVVDLSIGWILYLLHVHVGNVLEHEVKQNYLIEHFLHEILRDQLNYEQTVHRCFDIRSLLHQGLLFDVCWQLSWNLNFE